MPRTALASFFILATAALLAGCAHSPQPMNYGHPALNAAAAPTVVVVQQPVYVAAPAYSLAYASAPVYSPAHGHAYPAPYRTGYAAAPVDAPPAPAPRHDAGRAIVGGLVGGLVGSRFGKGEGRVAATALGAGLGTWMAVQD
ncbi:MAG: glycine zipper 2TM domain-containing protein [Burkholderiaceae bacterium]|nr:glycine zipper 2TM domain-containing protein [Burkholderiaceae bacterium]